MEPSETLCNKLKINSLKNNIILNKCLFVFDKLANNLPDVFNQFFKPFTEQQNYNTKVSQQYLIHVPETNTQMFGSNSVKTRRVTGFKSLRLNCWNITQVT